MRIGSGESVNILFEVNSDIDDKEIKKMMKAEKELLKNACMSKEEMQKLK